jgi:hypothetical protein
MATFLPGMTGSGPNRLQAGRSRSSGLQETRVMRPRRCGVRYNDREEHVPVRP